MNSTEAEILKSCIDILKTFKILAWRNNTGAFKDGYGHYIRFGHKGSPDIISVYGGQFIGIECKSKKGRQSDAQKDFQKKLEKAGGWYWLIKDPDELLELLTEHSII